MRKEKRLKPKKEKFRQVSKVDSKGRVIFKNPTDNIKQWYVKKIKRLLQKEV